MMSAGACGDAATRLKLVSSNTSLRRSVAHVRSYEPGTGQIARPSRLLPPRMRALRRTRWASSREHDEQNEHRGHGRNGEHDRPNQLHDPLEGGLAYGG
jgi:hypothetical protein